MSPIDFDALETEAYHFNHGTHTQAYDFLGVHPIKGEPGFQFTTWAPRAANVFVQGDFSDWDLIPMERTQSGMWTVHIPKAQEHDHYKYGIDNGHGHIEFKMDPFGKRHEVAPKDASIISVQEPFKWKDSRWLNRRRQINHYEHPMNIYEVHPASWMIHPDGTLYTLRELADRLIPYVVEMGYTHIELMPVMDHPLDASWGYQLTGYYAVCGRYGTAEDLKYFVNLAHENQIGVFLDWVPGHYSRNANALAYFDGTPTFEFEDPQRANNIGWGALNFDLGKNQVRSFLISNALYWFREFHIDGIRVDAVSNILYLDFDIGPWTPNEDGSNHSREGVEFLKQLNTAVHREFPDVIMMAEESTDWKGVTAPVEEGGLGFDYKWNLGWMNDTLKFFELNPNLRAADLRMLTFVYMYQYNENFILSLSHDEVVHGKNSLLGKMQGDRYTQFQSLRTLMGYMLAQPGKTLNFMGNELGQFLEWRYYQELEWRDLQREFNQEYQHFVKTINHYAKDNPAFYQLDYEPEGLELLDADDLENGTLSFIRQGKQPRDFVVVVCNFVQREHQKVRIGVPYRGTYSIAINSEQEVFGGTWAEPDPLLRTEEVPMHGQPYSIEIIIPSLSVLYIEPRRVYGVNA